MQVDVPYSPLTVHAPFHRASEYERQLFGAVGSGKSYAVCAEAIAWCLEQPGIRGLITRKTIPELRDTTEAVFFDILPDALYTAGKITRLGGHVADFTFPNGSKLLFRSIDDWRKHKSLNLGFIGWDEMDEFDLETYTGMKTRLRQRDPTAEGRRLGAKEITRRGTWGASNPEGHNWLYDYFIRDGNGRYFKSTSFDNPYLPPDYLVELLTMPEPWIKRYVLCQFDDFGGQIYQAWNYDQHVVPRYDVDPFTRDPIYPDHHAFWMGMDPGTENPTGGLWVVVERQPQVRLVGIAEYCEADLDAARHAKAWRQIEAKHRMRGVRRIADPNSVNMRDRGSNNRLADIYRRLGFSFDLGPSHYEDRIPALGTLIANGHFVVTEDCPQTYEAIKEARWKDVTPAARARGESTTERPLKVDRELVDCAEYLAGRYTKPVFRKQDLPPNMPEWQEQALAQIRKRVGSLRSPGRPIVEGIPT